MQRDEGYWLYYSPDSANLVVRLVLEELGARYRAVLVDRSVGEQCSEAYLRLNPQGLIPVLVDGEIVLFETAAIILHLADRHGDLAPAMGSPARPELYKWLFFLSNTLHADLRVVFYTHRYVESASCQGSVRAAVQRRVLRHFELLEAVIAGHDGPWLLASGLSVCDCYIAACARWAALYPPGQGVSRESLAQHKRLQRLLTSLEARPAVTAACAAEGIPMPFFSTPRPANPGEGSVL